MEGIQPADPADVVYAPHLEAGSLRTRLASLRQHVASLEAELAVWEGSQETLVQAIYQEAALPLIQHHEARIQELEEQLQGERRELARDETNSSSGSSNSSRDGLNS